MKEELNEEKMNTKVKKNQTAKVGEKYSYKYVDIAQIHEYLEQNNMRYYQYIDRIDNDDYIMTVPIIDDKEQKARRGCRVVDATLIGVNNPAQQQGSALTYARRYSLLMAFGLATEDDDAQSISITKEVTQEEADNYKFTFGKYKGKTIWQVYSSDIKYIEWLLNNDKTDTRIIKMIELVTGKTLPSEEEQKEIINKMMELQSLLEQTNTDRDKFYSYYKVTSNGEMTLEQLNDAIKKLKVKTNES